MNTIDPAQKRGRGRPRKYATVEEAQAARIARAADRAAQKRIAAADAAAAAQAPIPLLLATVPQAARALGVSEGTIANLVKAGRLSSIKVMGTRRIAVDELKQLAATGTE